MDQVIVKQIEDIQFVGKGPSNHWIPMDGPEDFGGMNAGSRPIELMLVSLGGCTGADVASLMKKMRVKLDNFEIRIDFEKAEEHPKVYTKIHLVYHFWGKDLDRAKLEKAIDLTQHRYCSASAMLSKVTDLTYEYIVHEGEE